jgi:hypothetical protein
MLSMVESYFNNVPSYLSFWKYTPTKKEYTSRWSKWSPVFTTPTGRPFQVRVNLNSHLVEFSEEAIVLDGTPLKQVTNYMKEVLNDNSVS